MGLIKEIINALKDNGNVEIIVIREDLLDSIWDHPYIEEAPFDSVAKWGICAHLNLQDKTYFIVGKEKMNGAYAFYKNLDSVEGE